MGICKNEIDKVICQSYTKSREDVQIKRLMAAPWSSCQQLCWAFLAYAASSVCLSTQEMGTGVPIHDVLRMREAKRHAQIYLSELIFNSKYSNFTAHIAPQDLPSW